MAFDQNKIDYIVKTFLQEVIEETISNIEKSGQTASGQTAESIQEVKVSNNEWILIGRKFIESLESGRGASGSGSNGGETLQERIYDWLPYANKYGITYDDDGQRVSLSWAIAKKIHNEGTLLHREGRSTGVLNDVFNSIFFSKFVNTLLIYYGGVITERLKNGFST